MNMIEDIKDFVCSFCQVFSLGNQLQLLDSNHVLFDADPFIGKSLEAIFAWPEDHLAQIQGMKNTSSDVHLKGVKAQFGSLEGVFDFFFVRRKGQLYWLIQDLSHAYNHPPYSSLASHISITEEEEPEKGCILVADSQPINLRVATQLLGQLGFQYKVASNGPEIIRVLESNQIELLLLDLDMTASDGLELFKHIKTKLDEKMARLPIIALVASGLAKDDPGFASILRKPLEVGSLGEAIKNALSMNSGLQQGKPPVVNMDYLREVTGNNHNLMVELIDIFLDEVPEAVSLMLDLAVKKSWFDLKELAHKTKANFRYVGADDLFFISDRVERIIAEKNQLKSIVPILKELKLKVNPLKEALLDFRKTLI